MRDYSYELHEGHRFHYKARVYSPKLGRFLQTDPIFYADQMNMYAYVGNDPVNKIDPTGMQTFDNCKETSPGVNSCGSSSSSDDKKEKAPDGHKQKYKTEKDAKVAAVKNINPKSIKEHREYAGRVYKNRDGTFGFTKPRKGTKDSSWHGPFLIFKKEVAGYHTHGGNDPGYKNEEFSSDDKATSELEGLPEVIGTPSGNIYEYTPIEGSPGQGSIELIGTGAL